MAHHTVSHAYNSRMAGFQSQHTQAKPADGAKTAAFDQHLTAEFASDSRTSGIKNMQDSAQSGEKWSFFDFLDVINPLQHIPIISTIYRSITGDEIKTAARAMGGMLYGGPIGMVAGIANGTVEDATGRDIPETLVAMATGNHQPDKPDLPAVDDTIMLAEAQSKAAIAPAAGQNTAAATTLIHQNSSRPDTSTTLSHSHLASEGKSVNRQKDSSSQISGKESLVPSKTVSAQHTLQRMPEEKPRGAAPQPRSLSMQNTSGDRNAYPTQQPFLPPELVAQQMMSALDQYSDMKKATQMSPSSVQ